ncbi:MAG: urea ABC transporter permease subunit UrtB [Hyphomicrobiaceae bacterium]
MTVLGLALAGAVLPSVANAEALDEALTQLKANSFEETEKAIDRIAASGSPRAAAILEALSDRRAFTNGSVVFYKNATGQPLDFVTGQPLNDAPSDARAVRTNNRLRGAIVAALGGLRLKDADPDKRRQAAEAVMRARDLGVLPALRAALNAEKNQTVSKAFREAEAALVLSSSGASEDEKLKAIAVLRDRSDQDAIAMMRAATGDKTASVSSAAKSAIAAVEQSLKYREALQNLWYGISLGSVLLLAAIGLAITFGVMGVINMAHGEMVMLGAYTTFLVQEAFRTYAPGAFDLSLPVALPLAFVVAGGIGIIIERGIIQYLYGRPLETLLATWGVSLILQQAVRTAFGPTNREVGNPSYMSGAFEFLGLQITYGRLWIVVFTLAVFGSLLLLLRATPLGLQMRAVSQNRRMAASMGIPTARVDALTFGLGSGIAGLAGVAISQIDNVSPNLGQGYIIDSFMVVVFGGVGNLWGTLVSAFALGITNKLLEPAVGAVLAKILILVLLILFIQKRPRGLFALKGRAVEQ